MSHERFAPIADDAMTPQQRAVADALISGPRGGIRGPFHALLRNPKLADRVRLLGDCIRFENSLPPVLRELVILIVARFWSANYEWHAHSRMAAELGLGPAIIEAIGLGKRPAALLPDESLVYDFCTELLNDKDIRDATYAAAVGRFGEVAVLDILCTAGYFGFVSLILNAKRHPIPDTAIPLEPLSRELSRKTDRKTEQMKVFFDSYEEAAKYLSEQGIKPGSPLTQGIEAARAAQDRYFAFLGQDLPPVDKVENLRIPGPEGDIPARLIYPVNRKGSDLVVFIRGAGFWAGSLDSHERSMREFANASGRVVCGIDYRRAPEHRYPVQVEEVLTALQWWIRNDRSRNFNPGRLVLWGESAGATLALSAWQRLPSWARTRIAGMVLFYGNFAGPKPSSTDYSKQVWRQYLGSDVPPPDSIPLLGDLTGLPPLWFGVGELDPLTEDTLALTERLDPVRSPYELHRYAGLPHGFIIFNRILGPAQAAIQDASYAVNTWLD
jgi:acetyl esterase/lipase/alkylhydroperoxidase family enzyme